MKDQIHSLRDFPVDTLSVEQIRAFRETANHCRGHILTMTTRAGSGHPAGSLSSLEMSLMTYMVANVSPDNLSDPDRDYVVVSHGHTSPATYAILGELGFFDPAEATAHFRACGSPFQGHVERSVPGVDWGSGNLGQGLSAGVGFALALSRRRSPGRVYVLMGDGEQTKGQVAEARRIASRFGLAGLTALVDVNHIQISGRTEDVMPADIRRLWEADDWAVLDCDGHSPEDLYRSLRLAVSDGKPTVILCNTVMGRGVSFMEAVPDYHGKAAGSEQYRSGMEELGLEASELDAAKEARKRKPISFPPVHVPETNIETGEPRTLETVAGSDNRSAFGKALADTGILNYGVPGRTPILVFDCDLSGSVKTDSFAKNCPEWFLQCGIQEHSVATSAGAASVAGVVSVWADFGVFGLSEVYNQQRLNDINNTALKLILTHVGLDVGEDGMTHQAIDYIGLLRNMFAWKLVVPVDPNQTDRAVRWALSEPCNVCIAMGRSKIPVIAAEDGSPLFASTNRFEYGRAVRVRSGSDAAVIVLGAMAHVAIQAADILRNEGKSVAVYSVSCPLAPDDDALLEAASTGRILTLEDHNVRSGMGSLINSRMMELGLSCRVSNLGVFRYGASGTAADVYASMGLDVPGVTGELRRLLGER